MRAHIMLSIYTWEFLLAFPTIHVYFQPINYTVRTYCINTHIDISNSKYMAFQHDQLNMSQLWW